MPQTNAPEESQANNDAVKLFLGETGNELQDLRQFANWYSNDILVYLTYLQTPSPDTFCYVFSRDTTDEEQSYYQQFVGLCHLSQALEKAICFIATESPVNAHHFIFGLIIGKELLLINSVGKTLHRDFAKYISRIKTLGGLQRIYNAAIVLQKEAKEEGLISCGPICAELMRHISQLPLKSLLKQFEQWQQAGREEVDITPLLPASLQALLPLGGSAYREKIITIRQFHLTALKHLEGTSEEQNERIAMSLACAEQALLFDTPQVPLNELLEEIIYVLPIAKLRGKYPEVWCKKAYWEALAHGQLEKVQGFLQANLSLLNRLNLHGYTPLMQAIQQNHPQLVTYLLEQGASLEAGATAYADAVEFAHMQNKNDFAAQIEKYRSKKITSLSAFWKPISKNTKPKEEEQSEFFSSIRSKDKVSTAATTAQPSNTNQLTMTPDPILIQHLHQGDKLLAADEKAATQKYVQMLKLAYQT